MTLEIQMTRGLLQDLLMPIRANDYCYKSWLAVGINELGRGVAAAAISSHPLT